jgi:signal transduction histidine kinase
MSLRVVDTLRTEANVPDRFGFAARVDAIPGVSLLASADRTNWSKLNGLGSTSASAEDAWEYAVGAEFSAQRARITNWVYSVGFRTRDLPFAADGRIVSERALTGGLSAPLAGSRATADMALQRATRCRFRREGARLAPQPGTHRAPVIPDGAVLENPLILADDSAANCELLGEQLPLGYRPLIAHDGPSALDLTLERQPALVILDVNMPAGELHVDDRATGFEVCRRLKRDPRTGRIPVIFITALNESTDRVKAIEAGGDDFILPHNRLVLGARVNSLLKLKAATDALEEALRRQRELEHVRDDLMKMIVHDLKTPLTSILATLELLGDGDFGPLAPNQQGVVQDALHKSEELLTLIDDLLEVRRIEESSITLSLDEIDAAGLINEIAKDWAVRFEQEKTRVHTEIAGDLPRFTADRGLIKRVLGNLIQNALVHSAGSIDLTLACRAEPPGLRFSVSDTGPGIPAEYHEMIFRKFQQFQATWTPRARTSGLGLTFCRLVTEAHGGRIWVQSAPGKGSTFHVALPLVPPSTTVQLTPAT